jgi:DNA-binding FrmR family transcriptional regulator
MITSSDHHDKKPLLDRLSRAEGQIRALRQALERGEVEDCKAFISQIKAARTALKRTSEQYVLQHIHTCQSLPQAEREQQISEALKVLSSD